MFMVSSLIIIITLNSFVVAEISYFLSGDTVVNGIPNILEGLPDSNAEICLFVTDGSVGNLERDVSGTVRISDARRTAGVDSKWSHHSLIWAM